MTPRPILLVVCLLVTALAATPLSARDLEPAQLQSASWLEEMTNWAAALWENLFGPAGPGQKDPKNLELPPQANSDEGGGATPGGSCIDPNGPPNCGGLSTW